MRAGSETQPLGDICNLVPLIHLPDPVRGRSGIQHDSFVHLEEQDNHALPVQ